ncbi:MAG: plasmid stability protein [Pseudomonas sp.]|jgi:plasmid stability protein
MASLTIRKLDKSLKKRLQTQAAINGRSIEGKRE